MNHLCCPPCVPMDTTQCKACGKGVKICCLVAERYGDVRGLFFRSFDPFNDLELPYGRGDWVPGDSCDGFESTNWCGQLAMWSSCNCMMILTWTVTEDCQVAFTLSGSLVEDPLFEVGEECPYPAYATANGDWYLEGLEIGGYTFRRCEYGDAPPDRVTCVAVGLDGDERTLLHEIHDPFGTTRCGRAQHYNIFSFDTQWHVNWNTLEDGSVLVNVYIFGAAWSVTIPAPAERWWENLIVVPGVSGLSTTPVVLRIAIDGSDCLADPPPPDTCGDCAACFDVGGGNTLYLYISGAAPGVVYDGTYRWDWTGTRYFHDWTPATGTGTGYQIRMTLCCTGEDDPETGSEIWRYTQDVRWEDGSHADVTNTIDVAYDCPRANPGGDMILFFGTDHEIDVSWITV